MIILIIFLSIIIIALSISIRFLLLKCFELQDKIENITLQTEESLDIIDYSYSRIANVLQLNVAYDDPVVRQLLQDIRNSKDALLLIANKIGIEESESQIDGKAEKTNNK